MKKRVVIPRKDHEVYFIKIPPELKKSKHKREDFLSERITEMHPGDPSVTTFDQKKCILEKELWYMITAINSETLIEYRTMNPGALFFTPTSILIYTKEFTFHDPYYSADEKIFFDRETASPVSLPCTETPSAMNECSGEEVLNIFLKKCSSEHSVFVRKTKRRKTMAAAMIFFCLLLFCFPGFKYLHRETTAPLPVSVEEIPAPQLPSAFQILVHISRIIVSSGGTLSRWQYSSLPIPECIIGVNNCNPDEVYAKMSALKYLAVKNISDITYTRGTAQYTLVLAADTAQYRLPQERGFAAPSEIFSLTSEIRTGLSDSGIELLSEQLPSVTQENHSYTIIFSTPASAISSSILSTEKIISELNMRIQQISVSFDTNTNRFSISCGIVPLMEPDRSGLTAESFSILPAAFGYIPPEKKTSPVQQKQLQKIDLQGYTRLGTIRQGEGKSLVYYRNTEGKIIIHEE